MTPGDYARHETRHGPEAEHNFAFGDRGARVKRWRRGLLRGRIGGLRATLLIFVMGEA
jgi:hypothetical protein